MDLTSVLVISCCRKLSFLPNFQLGLRKVKDVSQTDHEALKTKFNETNTQLKLEDRLLSHQQEHSKLDFKFESRENELTILQPKSAFRNYSLEDY